MAEIVHPLWRSIGRGLAHHCPACGTGPLYGRYLKVAPTCADCGYDLSRHPADDGPAYLTILLVGHLMAPLILFAFVRWRPDPLVLSAVFSVGTVALSLYLLPRLKGALVALQWAKRMHGFSKQDGGIQPGE